ncbi:E3 ubiquitin-protein ligase TRIM56-like [Polypterus senegalus]
MMAAADAQLSDTIEEEFLKCKICFELFASPRVLPCLHTYCEQCLVPLIAQGKGRVCCPECRSETDVHGNVCNIKPNFFINGLLDLFKSRNGNRDAACSTCLSSKGTTAAAATRCLDCAIFLCRACTDGHRSSRLTFAHSLVSTKDYMSGGLDKEGVGLCQRHNETLRFFCDTCSTSLCRTCRMHDHQSHCVRTLADAVGTKKPQLQSLLSSLDGALESAVQHGQTVDARIEDLEGASESIKEQVSQFISRVIEQLFEQQSAVLSELQNFVTQQRSSYLAIKEQLSAHVSSAENTKNFCQQVMETGKDSQILQLESLVSSHIKKLQEFQLPPMDVKIPSLVVTSEQLASAFKLKFDVCANSSPQLDGTSAAPVQPHVVPSSSAETSRQAPGQPENLGRPPPAESAATQELPRTSGASPAPRNTSSPEATAIVVPITRAVELPSPAPAARPVTPSAQGLSTACYLRTFETDDSSSSYEENITGMSCFHNGDVALADEQNGLIKRFTRNGREKWNISLDSNIRPCSIAVCDNQIFFSSNKKIYKAFEDGDTMQISNLRGSQPQYPIAAYRNEYIAVSEGTACTVSLYDPEGKLMGRVQPRNYCGGKFLFLAVNSREDFIVTDTVNKKVLLFSRSGNILNTYQSPYVPFSICVDKWDNIYVVESNKRISQLDPDGDFQAEFVTFRDGFKPKLVTADRHGHVFVTNRSGSVRVYKIGDHSHFRA